MTNLGAEYLGDRVANVPEIVVGPTWQERVRIEMLADPPQSLPNALRLDGGPNCRGVDAEGLGELRDRGDAGDVDVAVPQLEQGARTDSSLRRECAKRDTAGVDELLQGADLASHGGVVSESSERFHPLALDKVRESSDTSRTKNSPGRCPTYQGGAAAEANQNPEVPMPATLPSPFPAAQLAEAEELLGYCARRREPIREAENLRTVLAARDSLALDDAIHTLRHTLGHVCGGDNCSELVEIDDDGYPLHSYCSRQCRQSQALYEWEG